jgi:hypothetical protein
MELARDNATTVEELIELLQMLDASTPVWGLTVQGQKRPVLVTLYEHGAYVR